MACDVSIYASLGSTARCPICLDVISQPQMFPCGHSYCTDCIAHLPESKSGSDAPVLCCPECRQLSPVSELRSNLMLGNLISTLQSVLRDRPTSVPAVVPKSPTSDS